MKKGKLIKKFEMLSLYYLYSPVIVKYKKKGITNTSYRIKNMILYSFGSADTKFSITVEGNNYCLLQGSPFQKCEWKGKNGTFEHAGMESILMMNQQLDSHLISKNSTTY